MIRIMTNPMATRFPTQRMLSDLYSEFERTF
jgi:hypothetical protein